MNSQLRHLSDPDILEFDAQITAIRSRPDGRFEVKLDQTYFYATGGGQEHDTGWLGTARVVDVKKDESTGMVWHVTEGEPPPGRVHGKIDPLRRQRHRQHHTAQHLLSACFLQRFDIESISANINGDTPSTIDLASDRLERDVLVSVEDMANEIIFADRPVKSYFVTPAELQALPLRRPPKVSDNIRIVEIEGFDYTPCGGTHVTRTGMIGLVKIIKTERQNEKLRIYFVAGWQAIELFRSYYHLVTDLANGLSLHPQELPAAFQRQSDALKETQREIRELRLERLALEAESLAAQAEARPGGKWIVQSYTNRPAAELRQLAEKLKSYPGLAAVLVSLDGSKTAVLVACGTGCSLAARDLLARLMPVIGGRGGGDAHLAQGGGPANTPQLEALIAEARTLLKG